MTDPLLAPLIELLDLVVIERLADRSMRLLTPAPRWFVDVAATAARGEPVTLDDALPFLGHFLEEAEAFWWTRRNGAHIGEPFAVRGTSEEHLLRPRAVTVLTRTVIVLDRLGGHADPRPVLQAAREARLEHERLKKDVEALRPPATTLARLVERLLETDLAPAPRELAQEIIRASGRLRTAVDALDAR
jgi:hypothetical protein